MPGTVRRFEIRLAAASPARTAVALGPGALAMLAEAVGRRHVLLVTDANVERAGWADAAVACMPEAEVASRGVLASGEHAKRMAAVERLWDEWSLAGAGRDSVVVAVGGGVACDVSGFAAATFLRGVAWIAVPTTTLAMADAAVGGKVGVNTARGKNLAGAVHHPEHVVADTRTLETLAPAVWLDGWAEVVKAGAIGDSDLLDELERQASVLRARDGFDPAALLERSLRVKASVVEADPREASRREILNFGHTVGHALEHATEHAVSHGQAVAIGMAAESRLARAAGLLDARAVERIAGACRGIGLPVAPPPDLDLAAFRAALGSDKKRRGGRLRVALPEGLGRHGEAPGREVSVDEIVAALGPIDSPAASS